MMISNNTGADYTDSIMMVDTGANALRDTYLDALALSGVGEDGHGDVYAALALDLLDTGHGRHSIEWRALAEAFDIVCRFDATAQDSYRAPVTGRHHRVTLAKA